MSAWGGYDASNSINLGKNSVLWLVPDDPDAWSTFIADQICHPIFQTIMWHVLRFSGIFFWKNRSRPGAIFSGFSWSGERKRAALNFILGNWRSKVLRGKASLEIVNKHFQSHKGDFLTPKFGASFWEIGPGLGLLGAAFKLIPDVCTKPKLHNLGRERWKRVSRRRNGEWRKVRCLEVRSVEKHIITLWQFVTCDCHNRGTCISKCRGDV